MNRIAVIDIGSNSVKLFICERSEKGGLLIVHDENEVVRLGERLHESGEICPQAMERGVSVVERFVEKAAELATDMPVCVGTMTLRCAGNSQEFLRRVKDACGIEVQIIPGDEEARLSYLAVRSTLAFEADESIVVFDTGGGSTEFIYGKGIDVAKRFSLNVGSVSLTERFFYDDPVAEDSVEKATAYIDSVFAAGGIAGHPDRLVGIGGNVTSMGSVKHKMRKFDRSAIQGATLTLADVDEQIAQYRALTIEQRRSIPGLSPKRADIVLSGACIVKVIMERLDVKQLTICDRGLRYGLAVELLGKETNF